MKIGIISDTHDHLDRTGAALDRFVAAGVEQVLHAGDLCSPFVILEFKKRRLAFTAVFGNNDGEWLLLVEWAKGTGEVKKGPIALEFDDRNIALMHEPVFLDALADSGHFDLVVYGHTHVPEQRTRGKAVILNPGAASGYMRDQATAMIVDLQNMEIETIILD